MGLATKSRKTIGAAAKEAYLGAETIRLYEREGLFGQPPKISKFRCHADSDIKTLRFIRKVRTPGFSDAIKASNKLEVCSEDTSIVIQTESREKVHEIKHKTSVEQISKSLQKFSKASASGKKASTGSCSVVSKDRDCSQRPQKE